MDDYLELYRTNDVLSGFSAQTWAKMVDNARIEKWKAGDVVAREGEKKFGAFVALSGVLAFEKPKYKQPVIIPMFAGQCCFFDVIVRPDVDQEFSAVSDVTALTIPTNKLVMMIRSDIDLALACWTVTATNMTKELDEHLAYLAQDVEQRISRFLSFYLQHSVPLGQNNIWPWQLTQVKLGAIVGASRPYLATTIKAMQEKGMFRIDGKRIIVPPDSSLLDNEIE